jgi:hypothetical protein
VRPGCGTSPILDPAKPYFFPLDMVTFRQVFGVILQAANTFHRLLELFDYLLLLSDTIQYNEGLLMLMEETKHI